MAQILLPEIPTKEIGGVDLGFRCTEEEWIDRTSVFGDSSHVRLCTY